MGLSNALFAGLSGLDVNQTRLSVVSNNIANVNTVAFRSSRVLFKPQFYVTDSGGSRPDGEFGGTNPSLLELIGRLKLADLAHLGQRFLVFGRLQGVLVLELGEHHLDEILGLEADFSANGRG